jgi:hypothetical protein
MKPTDRQRELALEVIVETVLEHSQYPVPRKGSRSRSQFDLCDFLEDHLNSSHSLALYVLALSSDSRAFDLMRDRERNNVELMLFDHLRDSDIVNDLAAEYAEEESNDN